jgi:hypothetical protein
LRQQRFPPPLSVALEAAVLEAAAVPCTWAAEAALTLAALAEAPDLAAVAHTFRHRAPHPTARFIRAADTLGRQ